MSIRSARPNLHFFIDALSVQASWCASNSRKPYSILCFAILVLTQSGCIFIPSAQLVATPSKQPAPGCTATQTSPVSSAQDAAGRLTDSLARVRNAPDFVVPVAADPVAYSSLVDEAALLVHKAQAAEKAKGGGPAVTEELKQDSVEVLLINLLPWAGTTDTAFPEADNIKGIAENGLGLIKAAAQKADSLNKLLPDAAKTSVTATSPAGPSATGPTTTATLYATAVPGETVKLANFSRADHENIFKNLTTLAAFRTFHLLALLSAAHLHEMFEKSPAPTDVELDTEIRVFNTARFLSAYFDAYFRGGQFIQFTLDEKAFVATLSTDIQKRLQSAAGLQADDIAKLIQPEFDKLCDGPNKSSACSASLGSAAFVTRAGLTVQFSGVSFAVVDKGNIFEVSHTYPQAAQFGPQMIRVLVEAIFDANGMHPKGAANSTACQEKLFSPDECVKPTDSTEENRKLADIDMLSAAAEALSSTATGALIRGVNAASLNNETVAQVLETFAGVNARKISEKVLYVASDKGVCKLTTVALRVEQ